MLSLHCCWQRVHFLPRQPRGLKPTIQPIRFACSATALTATPSRAAMGRWRNARRWRPGGLRSALPIPITARPAGDRLHCDACTTDGHTGGRSELLIQRSTFSDFNGSAGSHRGHRKMAGPLLPAGRARISLHPHLGQAGSIVAKECPSFGLAHAVQPAGKTPWGLRSGRSCRRRTNRVAAVCRGQTAVVAPSKRNRWRVQLI